MLPPLGSVARLVTTSWATCALTTTGRAWCFSALTRPAHEIQEWDGVTDIVSGYKDVVTEHGETACKAVWMCALMKGGRVACASNVKSKTLRALGGSPWGGDSHSELSTSQYSVCGDVLDGVHAEDALWIGELDIFKRWHEPVCESGAAGGYDGVVVGRKESVTYHRTMQSGSHTCCEGTYGTCEAFESSLCVAKLAPAERVVGWSGSLGLMEDGSWRDPPFRPEDEVKELRGVKSFVLGPGGTFLCALETTGTVRCANDPSYALNCGDWLPKRPRHAWHPIGGIKHATAIAASLGMSAVCVLEDEVPLCWGRDGRDEVQRTPNGVLGPRLGDDICPMEDGTPVGCQKTPRAIDGVQHAVQIVAAGGGHGFCVLDTKNQVICWGPGTKGLPHVIEPPHRDKH